jgi:arginase
MGTIAIMPSLNLLGVPISVGSYSVGQEQAPRALREGGLVEALKNAGNDVHDVGDLTMRMWTPDRERRFAQNLPNVVESVRELASAVPPLLEDGDRLLVLGGNCTIALGVCAGLRGAGIEPSLVYVDRHFDLNTPQSTTEGALDWMGLAHALALEGAATELVDAFGYRPLLAPSRISFLGVDANEGTEWEREQVQRMNLPVVSLKDLTAAPRIAAGVAVEALPKGPFAVHVDVDVLDFIDAPIAENVNGRNVGPTVEQLGDTISELWRNPACRALSVGELNPVHATADPASLPRFIATLARALTPSRP